mmetsp:Transcript_21398/g.64286  ORF Transcript_21398/g.64286 Transcript_21398/m.64286 type:complete len:216 (-) Transcript_21398:81-728(-)
MARTAIVALALTGAATALAPTPSSSRVSTRLNAYVPDGLSPEQWKKMQAKEKEVKKNLGVGGARGFKSRSFNSFVEALEKGEATHLFAVDPRKIKSGEVPIEEVPYMQRSGGAWDGSDLKGNAKRRAVKKQEQGMYTAGKWQQSDKDYENGGKDKVMSFFSSFNSQKGDVKERAAKNKVSEDTQLWRDAGALNSKQAAKLKASKLGEEKKFFGLF